MGLQRIRLANAEKVKKLVDSAFASRYHDLPAMLRFSSEAVVLAEEKRHEMPADLAVAAWTQYGNALRIAGRRHDAERALERAVALEAFDPSTRANLLEIKASLYRDTDRLESAAQFLLTAIDIHKSIGDALSEARAWNLLGIVCVEMGDRPRALFAFRTALDLLGTDAPIDLVVMTGHNLMEALIEDGRLSAAASVLALLEPFYRSITSPRWLAKAEWTRGRLCWKLQKLPDAQLAYERARALLIIPPASPELPELMREMAELEAMMGAKAGECGGAPLPGEVSADRRGDRG